MQALSMNEMSGLGACFAPITDGDKDSDNKTRKRIPCLRQQEDFNWNNFSNSLNQHLQNVQVRQQPGCASSKQGLFADFVSAALGAAWDKGPKITLCNLVSPIPEARASPQQDLRQLQEHFR